jgi:hypothetical protein
MSARTVGVFDKVRKLIFKLSYIRDLDMVCKETILLAEGLRAWLRLEMNFE